MIVELIPTPQIRKDTTPPTANSKKPGLFSSFLWVFGKEEEERYWVGLKERFRESKKVVVSIVL